MSPSKKGGSGSATVICLLITIIIGLTVATLYSSSEPDVDASDFHSSRTSSDGADQGTGGGAAVVDGRRAARSRRAKSSNQQQSSPRSGGVGGDDGNNNNAVGGLGEDADDTTSRKRGSKQQSASEIRAKQAADRSRRVASVAHALELRRKNREASRGDHNRHEVSGNKKNNNKEEKEEEHHHREQQHEEKEDDGNDHRKKSAVDSEQERIEREDREREEKGQQQKQQHHQHHQLQDENDVRVLNDDKDRLPGGGGVADDDEKEEKENQDQQKKHNNRNKPEQQQDAEADADGGEEVRIEKDDPMHNFIRDDDLRAKNEEEGGHHHHGGGAKPVEVVIPTRPMMATSKKKRRSPSDPVLDYHQLAAAKKLKKNIMNDHNKKEKENAAFGVGLYGDAHATDPQPVLTHAYATKHEHDYIFELDRPRQADEEDFTFKPKSRGGTLTRPTQFPSDIIGDTPEKKRERETLTAAHYLYQMFALYDKDETSNTTMPVYGTMCVGKDCEFILPMFRNLRIGIGHFIVVVSTSESRWVNLFGHLQELFPGRFSAFQRPEKLSCAESWNLVVRMAFSIRPMIDQVFIANADWNPKPCCGVDNQMARYAAWSRTQLKNVLNRYMHFSSFSYTKKGYLELGYFDEVIYPALAEDVEFHIKAVSKGLGHLGLYDNWRTGSNHIHRASGGEQTVKQRHGRVARFDYIMRKWGVSVPSFKDFMHSRPFKTPFNIKGMFHNNSWAVDPKHRLCAKTGAGLKMTSGRCYYDPHVLLRLLPEDFGKLPDRLTTIKDSFPGNWH